MDSRDSHPMPEPPTISVGIANQGLDSDDVEFPEPPNENDFPELPNDIDFPDPPDENDVTKFDDTSSYVYSINLDVADCNAKIDDSSSFVYTNKTFLNVGGQDPRAETASILDAFASDGSQSLSNASVGDDDDDGSSISYKENIVV